MDGWIKLWREVLDKPIWLLSSPEQKSILITLLLMANHEAAEWEWKGEKITCKPGQAVTSLDSIARKAGKGVTVQNVRTALRRFEKLGFLTNESTKAGRLITIENYALYQCDSGMPGKEPNKGLTKGQQSPNKGLTPNKNNKNNKNNKKIYISPALGEFENVLLTGEELEKLKTRFPHDWQQRIESLSRYMESKGRRYKNHYATILAWERRDNGSGNEGQDKPAPGTGSGAGKKDYGDANGIRFG